MIQKNVSHLQSFFYGFGFRVDNGNNPYLCLQRVRTIPGVRPGAVRTPGLLRGQTEFQSAWVRVAAWCQARHRL